MGAPDGVVVKDFSSHVLGMSKTAVEAIIQKFGEDRICAELGVGPESLRRIRWRGRFPQNWGIALMRLADKDGFDLRVFALENGGGPFWPLFGLDP